MQINVFSKYNDGKNIKYRRPIQNGSIVNERLYQLINFFLPQLFVSLVKEMKIPSIKELF